MELSNNVDARAVDAAQGCVADTAKDVFVVTYEYPKFKIIVTRGDVSIPSWVLPDTAPECLADAIDAAKKIWKRDGVQQVVVATTVDVVHWDTADDYPTRDGTERIAAAERWKIHRAEQKKQALEFLNETERVILEENPGHWIYPINGGEYYEVNISGHRYHGGIKTYVEARAIRDKFLAELRDRVINTGAM